MSASGVGVNNECLNTFNELKLGKRLKYITFTLNEDDTEIVVEKTGAVGATYDDFLACFPAADCRWAIYDFDYEKADGRKRNKITFYSWSPDDAKIKRKMLFASSKDALRRSLVGISTEIQGTEYSEIAHEAVFDKVSRGN